MAVERRTKQGHALPFFLAAVGFLIMFAGCAPTKNMLVHIFGDSTGKPDPAIHEIKPTVYPIQPYELARHFQMQGRHLLAVDQLIKVIQADPYHVNAYNALGVSYDRLREFDLAGNAYQKALEIDPALAYVHNNVGYSNLLQGKLGAAAKAFETAVSLDSTTPKFQNNLSLALARLGEIEPENHTSTQKPDDIYYTIQLGVYYDLDQAVHATKNALGNGNNLDNLDSPYITRIDRDGPFKPYYRVRAGRYLNRSRAEKITARLKADLPKTAYVTRETDASMNLQARADLQDTITKPVIIQTNRDIEILNGNGVRHMAKTVQEYLSGQGITVNRIANAPHFSHPRTVIYYAPGYYAMAREVQVQLQALNTNGKMIKSGALKTNIRIILGRDLAA